MPWGEDLEPDLYQRLEQQLRPVADGIRVSETHGLLCGMLCGHGSGIERRWLDEVSSELPGVERWQAVLHELYRQTEADLTQPGMGFQALLPSDDRPLRERARALAEWCEGFLYGFGLSHSGERELAHQVQEALHDLAQFTQVEQQTLRGTEEDEAAYVQIAEFVWVAAMLIYHDES